MFSETWQLSIYYTINNLKDGRMDKPFGNINITFRQPSLILLLEGMNMF